MKTFFLLLVYKKAGGREHIAFVPALMYQTDGQNKPPKPRVHKVVSFFLSKKTNKTKLHNAQSLEMRIVAAHIQQQVPPPSLPPSPLPIFHQLLK